MLIPDDRKMVAGLRLAVESVLFLVSRTVAEDAAFCQVG